MAAEAASSAAFFDLDGTLLPSPSLERRLVLSLIQRGELGIAQAARWLARFLRLAARDWCAATSENKAYLAGVSVLAPEAWMAARYPLGINFYPQGLDIVRRHVVLGYRIVFVSGTLAPLGRAVAREAEDRLQLRAPIQVCATELEAKKSKPTKRRASGDNCRTLTRDGEIFTLVFFTAFFKTGSNRRRAGSADLNVRIQQL